VTFRPDPEILRAIQQAQRQVLPEPPQNIQRISEAARLSAQAQQAIDRALREHGLDTSAYAPTSRMLVEEQAHTDLARNIAERAGGWQSLNLQLSLQSGQLDAVNRLLEAYPALRNVAKIMDQAQSAYTQAMKTSHLLRSVVPTSLLAAQTSVGVIAGRLEALDLLATHPMLSARLLEPHAAYAQFVESTARRFQRSSSQHALAGLDGALIIGNDLVLNTCRTLNDFFVEPIDDDTPVPSPRLNVQSVVRRELTSNPAVRSGMNVGQLLSLAPAGHTALRARRVGSLVAQCIELHDVAGQRQIFRGTTKLWSSCNDLPFATVRDRTGLGELIDRLYFVFYEGTGSGGRLISDNFRTDEDCAFVWNVKHLRTWLRHDEGHGGPGKVQAKRRDILNALEWFGLQGIPRTADEYQYLHRRLIEDANRFTEDLQRAL